MKKTWLMALLLTVVGCGLTPDERRDVENAGEQTAIAARIKSALIEQAPSAAAAVDIDVRDGVIYLRGFADSQGVRKELEAAARAAAGNRRVVNQIELR